MRPRFFFIFFFFLTSYLFGQEGNIQINFSEKHLTLKDSFSITIQYDTRIKNLGNFPEIPDFLKGNTYFKKENKIFYAQQIYYPTKVGTFALPDFAILVNEKSFPSKGVSLRVSFARAKQLIPKRDIEKFEETHPDLRLLCKSSKDVIYLGEPFVIDLSINIAVENSAEINFVDLNSQLNKLRSKLKPNNCWMEDFNTLAIDKGEKTIIDSKKYISFTLAKISLTPLDSSDIKIPSLSLKMIKYKVRKTKNLIERIPEEFEIPSQVINIKIHALPPHPLRNVTPAGIYTLYERLYNENVNTGEGTKYTLTIIGKNVSRLTLNLNKEVNPDIFERKISYRQVSSGKEVIGEKTFEYFIMPTEPGEYNLTKYFNLIFFNTIKHEYDTLLPRKTLVVSGESRKNNEISFDREDEFYSLIKNLNDNLIDKQHDNTIKIVINAFIIVMLLSTLVLILKR
ncbi:MAG TPA: hypothetical protein VF691_18065 [Cytophagaceae bacterium]|jgi:hypothetical protein